MTGGTWFSLSVQAVKRGDGRSAVAAAAYRSRSALMDDRTGRTHDYSHREETAYDEIVLPDGASQWMGDRQALWNAVEKAERHPRAVVAREFRFALPHAASLEIRVGIAWLFASYLVKKFNIVIDMAIHPPPPGGDPRNWHAHLLATTRPVDPDSPTGFGNKVRELDPIACRKAGTPNMVSHLRAILAGQVNATMVHFKLPERVDHRSYESRGVDLVPQPHLGPGCIALERRGQNTELGSLRTLIQEENFKIARLTLEIAAVRKEREMLIAMRDRFDVETSRSMPSGP